MTTLNTAIFLLGFVLTTACASRDSVESEGETREVELKKEDSQPLSPADKPDVAGGDSDAHGCIASAGYTWCEAKKECVRGWELEVDGNKVGSQLDFDKVCSLIPNP